MMTAIGFTVIGVFIFGIAFLIGKIQGSVYKGSYRNTLKLYGVDIDKLTDMEINTIAAMKFSNPKDMADHVRLIIENKEKQK